MPHLSLYIIPQYHKDIINPRWIQPKTCSKVGEVSEEITFRKSQRLRLLRKHNPYIADAHNIIMGKRFLVYGILGWVLEVLWTGAGSALQGDPRLVSQTYLWMFPIYGSAVLLEPLHDRIRRWPWVARGLLWTALIFGIEYSSGWALQTAVGRVPWDYSEAVLSVDNFIRLDYAPAWFVAGLLFERVHDWLRVRVG